MKSKNPTKFLFGKVLCNVFGHNLRVSKNVTHHIHEYKCRNCGMEMTDTANGVLARLTPKFKETNDYISMIYQKRKGKFFAESS